MSQTKNELEAELKEFKDTHTDWMKVEWKANVVNGYNVRLTTFQPTGNLPLTSDPLVIILILPHFCRSIACNPCDGIHSVRVLPKLWGPLLHHVVYFVR
jgi:hypothetical protein